MQAPVASTHVFHFRSARDARRSLVSERRRLAAVDGLRFARLVFVGATKTEGFTIGIVDPRRQMALCIWEHESCLDSFLEGSATGRAWREATDEYCELRATPFRSHGTYRGLEPLAALEPTRPDHGPVALWTFANIPLRSLTYFWSGIRGATASLLTSPALIAGTAGPEHIYRGAMTFTLWKQIDEALGFAYRTPPHREIVSGVREHNRLIDSMFIRMSPYRASGTWPSTSRFAPAFQRFADSIPSHVPV